MEATEITVTLDNPFTYSYRGDSREAEFITIHPPTMRQHKQAAALKQSIIQMSVKAATGADSTEEEEGEAVDDPKSEDDEGFNAEEIILTLYASEHVDINVVFQQAEDLLLCQGIAMIDGEQKLNGPLMQKMTPDDFEKLVGEYIANFTTA